MLFLLLGAVAFNNARPDRRRGGLTLRVVCRRCDNMAYYGKKYYKKKYNGRKPRKIVYY